MARIVGYTRKEWPKWPYVVFVLFVLLAALIVFLFTLSKSAGKKTTAATTTATTTTTTTFSSTTIPKSTLIPWFKAREESEEEAKIKVEKIIFTSGIDEFNRNIDSFKEIPADRAERFFCYTEVNSSAVPAVIRHVWFSPDGSQVADIKLDIFTTNAATWSYINLSGAPAGDWKVVVKTAEGRKIGENKFQLYQ